MGWLAGQSEPWKHREGGAPRDHLARSPTVSGSSRVLRHSRGIRQRGWDCVCVCLEKRVTVARVSQRNPCTQTPSAGEIGGAGSPPGPRGPIGSQGVAPVATGIPSLCL